MKIIMQTEKELIFIKNDIQCKIEFQNYGMHTRIEFHNSKGELIKNGYFDVNTPDEIIAKFPSLFEKKYVPKVPKGTKIIKFSEVNKEIHIERGDFKLIYDKNEISYCKLISFYKEKEIDKNSFYFDQDSYNRLYTELLRFPVEKTESKYKKMGDLIDISINSTGFSGNFKNYYYKPAVVSYIVHPYEAIFLVKGAKKYFTFKVTQTLYQILCEEAQDIKKYFEIFNKLKDISNNKLNYMEPSKEIQAEIMTKLV